MNSDEFHDPQRDSFGDEPVKKEGSNLKWWLLFGCLPVVVLLVCCGGCGGFFVFIMGTLKDSAPYVDSLLAAKSHPDVIDALGEPIEAGFLVQGNLQINNNKKTADITYDISGPKGTATVRAAGTGVDKVWTYDTMTVTLPTGETINLMASQQ
ncbi:MAG: cytochrome c oxidase assembly factor Coa1 family protein [Planctomycetaceae bacterium]